MKYERQVAYLDQIASRTSYGLVGYTFHNFLEFRSFIRYGIVSHKRSSRFDTILEDEKYS